MNVSVPVNTTTGTKDIPIVIEGHGPFEPGYGCNVAANSSVGIPLLLNPNATAEEAMHCDPGWFCPRLNPIDPSTMPVYCPPSHECAMSRLLYTPCEAQGLYEPTICKPGYYCPVTTSMLICPPGSFCPTGSTVPIPCSLIFSNCPQGSATQQPFGFIILFGLLDLVVLSVLVLLRYCRGHLQFVPLRNRVLETSLARAIKLEAMQKSLRVIVEDYRESWGGGALHMNIAFKDLGVKLKSGKEILSCVSGEIRAGKMTAIMGPSGSGKTTLMNVLMGKLTKTSGDLEINGQHVDMKKLKKLVGYVPQDDVMLSDLTVRENILHSARVRLPNSWKKARIEEHVDHTLQALHLSNVLNTCIGDENSRGISGGQRKRVNIGIELVAAPLALFLDEPTSGLDSTTSLEVATILQSIAELGLTITAVIHQPRVEIFNKFDAVILLIRGGRAAYVGPSEFAQNYFEALGFEFEDASNPADTLMDILAGTKSGGRYGLSVEDLAMIWKHSSVQKRASLDDRLHEKVPKHLFQVRYEILGTTRQSERENEETFHAAIPAIIKERGASFLKQLMCCYSRSIVQQSRESRGFLLELIVATMAGSLIGVAISGKLREMVSGIYVGKYVVLSPAPLDVIAVCGFLMGVTIGLSGAPSAVKVFGEEKTVFWREAAAGHSSLAYYLAKNIATIFRQALTALHFTGCFLYFAKPNIDPFIMFLIVLLQFWGVYGIACIVSLIVRRENASILSVVICLVLSVLCGYGPTLTDASQHGYGFLNEISFNKWASEAFYSSCITVYRGVFDVDLMTRSWGYTLDRVGLDLVMCFLIGLGLRVLGYLLLIGLHRDKQR
ncbi:hypothetical protein HDU81_002813 [Chytriomyces hyalinus]|nr:hypothetical protein HDU81_002813 [Chytriomyces hyalinus]